MKKIILSAKELCKSYAHNGAQSHILEHINLDIYEGDFTIIMGASGSGKSTLLYALSGMDRATSGRVIYKENNIVNFKEKELAKLRHTEFGFIFQQMHLVSNLSLYENCTVAGYLNKDKKASEINEKADELLKAMGLEKVKTHLPSQVSGGQQQRCAIARAVMNSPEILFADEPTGALNRHNTNEVLDLLGRLNGEGQSIIMVTHDMHAALRADRIIYLADGNIMGELTLPKYEKSSEKSRETQINSWLSSLEW